MYFQVIFFVSGHGKKFYENENFRRTTGEIFEKYWKNYWVYSKYLNKFAYSGIFWRNIKGYLETFHKNLGEEKK